MFRIAVVDDNQNIIDYEKDFIHCTLKRVGTMIDSYTNPELLLFDVKEGKQFELFLIDVELPNINGIKLAKTIRDCLPKSYIIFVTSHPEYAICGYDSTIRAFHYILKNRLKELLPATLLRIEQEYLESINSFYTIETQVRLEKINTQDIIYIYKEGKNAVFVTSYGHHKERKSLEQVFEDMNMNEMLFVERGKIANIRHINTVKENKVYLDNGDCLDISRAKIQEVKKAVSRFWRDNC